MKIHIGFNLILTVGLFFSLFTGDIVGQGNNTTVFKTIVLGSGGGIQENNLSAYLLAPKSSTEFICIDAGTVYSGIEQAVAAGNFYDVFVPDNYEGSKTGYIFRELIKGYLITHAHLDHIAGLVIASPASKKNNIYASDQTIGYLKKNIFNWETWPNFTDDGDGLRLGTFQYKTLVPKQKQTIEGTAFVVTAFPLSHQEPYESSAFLIEYYGDFVLYLGDTGADEIENSTHLAEIWEYIAPIIADNRLHAMFMECSYPDTQPDAKLYGHLSPKWMIEELTSLAKIVDSVKPAEALRGLPIIVTGIKPSWQTGTDNKYSIYKQLLILNKLGVKFLIPEQGQLIEF